MIDTEARKLRRLSTVSRWAVVPTIKRQSVAEHTYQGMVLGLWLIRKYTLNEIPSLFMHNFLMHDMDESLTGDIPSPAKSPKEIETEEYRFIKVVDTLEAWMYTQDERALGNSTLDEIESHIRRNFERHWAQYAGDMSLPTGFEVLRQASLNFNLKNHPILELV